MAKRGLGIALLLTAVVVCLWLLDRDAPDRTAARDAPAVPEERRARRARTPTPEPGHGTDAAHESEAEPAGPTPKEPAETKYVDVIVRNMRGEPVRGVWLRVAFDGNTDIPIGSVLRLRSRVGAFTDEQGRFQVAALAVEKGMRVGFSRDDLKPLTGDLVLEFHGIAGRLLGVDGKPVTRGVMLLRREGEDEILEYAPLAPDGYFAFPGVEDGLFRLSYKTSRAGSETTTIDGARSVPAGRTDVELRMQRGDTIEGIVLDENGAPREGVWVRTTAGTTLTGDGTDADGRFTVKGLDPAREYRLTTWIRGYVPEIREGIRPGTKDVRFTLDPGRRSTGRFVDADGKPRRGLSFQVVPASGHRIPLYPVTDGEGRFDLRGLPEGMIEARVDVGTGKVVDGQVVKTGHLHGTFTFRAGDRDLEFVLK